MVTTWLTVKSRTIAGPSRLALAAILAGATTVLMCLAGAPVEKGKRRFGLFEGGAGSRGLGRLPDEITHFQQAARLNPESVNAHYNLAGALTSAAPPGARAAS